VLAKATVLVPVLVLVSHWNMSCQWNLQGKYHDPII
jgi:hypothetical protein